MTYIWLHMDSDSCAFANADHIVPSLKLSYSACEEVVIVAVEETLDRRVYRITGKRQSKVVTDPETDLLAVRAAMSFSETSTFFLVHVHSAPTRI